MLHLEAEYNEHHQKTLSLQLQSYHNLLYYGIMKLGS